MTQQIYEEPLPEWAEQKSMGKYMQVRAQLLTRDGRKCGNAVVVEVLKGEEFARVLTDSGNVMTLNLQEMVSLFYEPKYIMKPLPKQDDGIIKETIVSSNSTPQIHIAVKPFVMPTFRAVVEVFAPTKSQVVLVYEYQRPVDEGKHLYHFAGYLLK